MSHAAGDDAQRELEQHALRNVSWLAEKLGYRDTIDKRVEKKVAVAVGIFTVVALAVLAFATMNAQTPAEEMARRRCEVQVRADQTMPLRESVFKEHPEMTGAQRDNLVEASVKDLAHLQCSKASPAR
jgi:hypothetical protein